MAQRALDLYSMAQEAFHHRRIHECLEFLYEAERIGHNADECASWRWKCWMLLGRFEDAWREGDAIAARTRPDPKHLWNGEPIRGRRVIVRCLHGFGDAIQFFRYVRLICSEAASVTVQTHPQLVSLFRQTGSVNRVTTWSDGPGTYGVDWDQQIEVMQLPRLFATTLATIPGDVPYLRVGPEHRDASNFRFGPKRLPRVGLLWKSGDWDPARNIPVDRLAPIFKIEGVEFFSFQRGVREDEMAYLHPSKIRDLSGESPDVAHFAADLQNVDLLITVDTMAAHLAGALGRPVWVLLHHQADWRWMLDRSDTPWYSTMRLYRQLVADDWWDPVLRIAQQLKIFAESPCPHKLLP